LSRRLVLRRDRDESEGRGRRSAAPADNQLTVLLVECNPDYIDGVKLDNVNTDEFARVRKALETIGKQVNVVAIADPSFDELRAKLRETQPRIVHYIGHGKPGHIALRKAREDDDFDPQGNALQYRWLDSNSVKAMFSDVKPRLVFLNACSTGASESIESFKSLARDLLYADVGGVVAMQYGITNGDAAMFAKAFYKEIARGVPIDEAAKAGRQELGLRVPPWAHPRFATPVVYVQDNEPIVTGALPPAASDPEAQRQRSSGGIAAGGLTA